MKNKLHHYLVIFLWFLVSSGLRAQVSFTLASSPGVDRYPTSVTSADVNGDGKADLISANWGGDNLTVLTNVGNGGFVLASSPGVGRTPICVTAADVNGDGKLDLISANHDTSTLTVLTNNGGGTFVAASSPSVGSTPYSVVAADVNGDGKLDLISANWGGDNLTVLTNNGSGTFVLASSPAVGIHPYSVVAVDVNGDGKVDLISANYGSSTLTVLTNNGSGSFTLSSSPGVGSGPTIVTAADVNGDGKVDLISANNVANTLSVLTNNGSGGFVLVASPAVGISPGSVTAADVNGDGRLDLISANNYITGTLTVLTNNTIFPAPIIAVPANIIVEATSASGAVVSFSTSATNLAGVTVTPTNTPASGSTFPLGTNTVIVTAISAGSSATNTFKVIVQDTTPPVITVPTNITTEATGVIGSSSWNYHAVSATDLVSGVVAMGFTLSEGTTLPLGTTTVTVTATDAAGNIGTNSFTVTVKDTTPPVIHLLGANPLTNFIQTPFVDPGATASDIYAGELTGAIEVSGTVNANAIGNYTLNYSVNDGNGNSAITNRTVVIVTPPPTLIIAPAGNEAVLFWSASGTNYILQSTTNLDSPNWVTASDAVPVISFTITNTSPARFFRLQPQ